MQVEHSSFYFLNKLVAYIKSLITINKAWGRTQNLSNPI